MNIRISQQAKQQILLMLDNDYTLTGKVLRISIDGKECHGFTYAFGFDQPVKNDSIIELDGLNIHLDPFIFSILKNGEIDYLMDPERDLDGFVITNSNESQFKGKFFKDPEKVPVIEVPTDAY